MLSLQINNLGKKFGSEWIFRNLSFTINAGDKIVILGGNGSGKSTLLQVISGYVTPNEGNIVYHLSAQSNQDTISEEKLRNHISFVSPYLQLIEDLTLSETIEHSSLFKPFINNLSVKEVVDLVDLRHAKDKFIRQLSSGMKQRLKLGLALLSNTPLLLLDEPVSNLDKNAILWYRNLISNYTHGRTIIVCSNNIEDEYFFCGKQLNVTDFKTGKQPV